MDQFTDEQKRPNPIGANPMSRSILQVLELWTSTHMHMCTQISTCMHIQAYVYTCFHVYIYIFIYLFIYTHAPIDVYICMYISVYNSEKAHVSFAKETTCRQLPHEM